MAAPPRLVNKQFNSPIGLYSQQNVNEVMQREQQILANGAVGIDFYNPQVGKPANLQNSAVLRMLEEEEHRQRGGRAGNDTDYVPRPLRDLNWPPQEYVHQQQRSSFKDVVIPGAKKVTWPPSYEESEFAEHPAAQPQGGPQYSQPQGLPQNTYAPQQQHAPHHQPSPAQYRPLKPLDVSSVASGSPLVSPSLNQSPHDFRPATPAKGWAPVHSPVGTPSQPQWRTQAPQSPAPKQPQYGASAHQQPASPAYSHNPAYSQGGFPSDPHAQYSSGAPVVQQSSSPYGSSNSPGTQYQSQSFAQPSPSQQNQAVAAQAQAAYRPPAKQVEPPPSTITLRQEAPVSQAPPPVYKSQPTTATLKADVMSYTKPSRRGGKHLRGDLKWPPEEVKERMQEEVKQQLELAKGPACKPRRQEKDYSRFFAQHALNNTYPGYKIPPGTQYFRPEY